MGAAIQPLSSSLLSIFLLVLALAVVPSSGVINVRFLHIYSNLQTPLNIYWTVGSTVFEQCAANYSRGCNIALPIALGNSYTVQIVNPANDAQLFYDIVKYDEHVSGLTWVLASVTNETTNATSPDVLVVSDALAYPENGTVPYGIVANLLSSSAQASDYERKLDLTTSIASLGAVTALHPLSDVRASDRVIITLAGEGQLAFESATSYNGSLVIAALFSGPPFGTNLLLYDVSTFITHFALPVPLPSPTPEPKHRSKVPIQVLLIGIILGTLGVIALLSCLVTWVQDVRQASQRDGYQPL